MQLVCFISDKRHFLIPTQNYEELNIEKLPNISILFVFKPNEVKMPVNVNRCQICRTEC